MCHSNKVTEKGWCQSATSAWRVKTTQDKPHMATCSDRQARLLPDGRNYAWWSVASGINDGPSMTVLMNSRAAAHDFSMELGRCLCSCHSLQSYVHGFVCHAWFLRIVIALVLRLFVLYVEATYVRRYVEGNDSRGGRSQRKWLLMRNILPRLTCIIFSNLIDLCY